MAKTGRPKVESPKKVLSVRMTEEELAELKEYATKNDLTITQAILRGVKILVNQKASKC